LLDRLRAAPDLSDIRVVDDTSVDADTFQFKVRADVGATTLQTRFLRDETFTRYSFQLYSDRPLLRWDNSPHYPDLPNFPHHFHDVDNHVTSSSLTGDLMTDIEVVLAEVARLKS